MARSIVVGYGNPDREDDGVAWHIVARLAEALGRPATELDTLPDPASDSRSPDLLCLLQLTPEIAELIAHYDRVCFVDAHTGAYEEDVRFQPIDPAFRGSPFTHHMTPETLVALAQTLYGKTPQSIVISVRGHAFRFSQDLSPATASSAKLATRQILDWLEDASLPD